MMAGTLWSRYCGGALTAARVCAVGAAVALPFSTAGTNVFLSLCFLLWLASGLWIGHLRAMARHPVAASAAVATVAILLGVMYSSAPTDEALAAYLRYRKLVLLGILIVLLEPPRWRAAVVGAFFGAVCVLLVISYAVFLLPAAWLPKGFDPANATFMRMHITHNFLMSLLAFAAFVQARQAQRSWVRWLAWAVFALAIINIFAMVQGRTGYLIVFALIAWAAVRAWRWKGVAAAIVLCGTAVALAWQFAPRFADRVEGGVAEMEAYRSQGAPTSMGLRLHYYKRSWQILVDHPWIGVGTGAWGPEMRRLGGADLYAFQVRGPGNPHSEYVHWAVQWGPLGLLALLALGWGWYRYAARLPERERWLAQGLIVAFATGCLLNSFLWDNTEGHAFIVLLGALLAYRAPRT